MTRGSGASAQNRGTKTRSSSSRKSISDLAGAADQRILSDRIFVYGTLRSGHPMNRLIKRYGERIGSGVMRGSLYDLGKYPGATAKSHDTSMIRGEVYRLREPKEALQALDRYEGIDRNDPARSQFRRVLKQIRLSSGRINRAWVYLYNRPTVGRRRIQSGDYRSDLRASER